MNDADEIFISGLKIISIALTLSLLLAEWNYRHLTNRNRNLKLVRDPNIGLLLGQVPYKIYCIEHSIS